MKVNYRVHYTESEEIITEICEVFNLYKNIMNHRVVTGVIGAMILIFMIIYGNPGGGTFPGILLFVIKFAAIWAVGFVVAEFLARTIGRSGAIASSKGDGKQMFEYRMRDKENPLEITMEFYDTRFSNLTEKVKKGFDYEQVVKLLESDRALGMLVRLEDGRKGFYGFPKDTLVSGEQEGFKNFMIEKCKNAKKGFVKV